MTSSIWRVSSGGQSTTCQIPTSSTDRLGGAISSRMTVLLLLSVFFLLSFVFFLTSLVVLAASTRITLGTLCSRPLQEIATRSIMYPCSLPLGLHISGSSSHVPLYNSLPMHGSVNSIATNVFDCWYTSTASSLMLVCPGFWSVGRLLLLSISSTSASSRRTLSVLLGILIKCALLSLSCHTA